MFRRNKTHTRVGAHTRTHTHTKWLEWMENRLKPRYNSQETSPFHNIREFSHPLEYFILGDQEKAITTIDRLSDRLYNPHLHMAPAFNLYEHEISIWGSWHTTRVHHLSMVCLLQSYLVDIFFGGQTSQSCAGSLRCNCERQKLSMFKGFPNTSPQPVGVIT